MDRKKGAASGVHQVSAIYRYDSAGNRVLSESVTLEDTSLGGTAVRTRVEYLTDDSNPTCYSQVLQETHYEVNANGDIVAPSEKIVYAVGHDQISQTVYAWDEANNQSNDGRTDYFGTDGHGSVRVLWDMLTAIVNDAAAGAGNQIFHFDAYGNLLSFAGAAVPLTSYLYSGESFDFNLGQQYLRARWYDATTGRFNRLDPYFGSSNDPQSFHKYAYVHGDPVMGIDPSGKFVQAFAAESEYNAQVLMLGMAGISSVLTLLALNNARIGSLTMPEFTISLPEGVVEQSRPFERTVASTEAPTHSKGLSSWFVMPLKLVARLGIGPSITTRWSTEAILPSGFLTT